MRMIFQRRIALTVSSPAPAASAADARTRIVPGGRLETPPDRMAFAAEAALSMTALSVAGTLPGGRRHRLGAALFWREFVSELRTQYSASGRTFCFTSRSTTTVPRVPMPTMVTPAPSPLALLPPRGRVCGLEEEATETGAIAGVLDLRPRLLRARSASGGANVAGRDAIAAGDAAGSIAVSRERARRTGSPARALFVLVWVERLVP